MSTVTFRDAETGVHDEGTAPCPFKGGETGAHVPLYNSIIGNFRDARERWNDGGIAPCPLHFFVDGAEVPFYNRIIGNFMVH